jgi:hypothetical protein
VKIMNLWNCRFSVIKSKEFMLLWKPWFLMRFKFGRLAAPRF